MSTPAADILSLSFLLPDVVTDPAYAYMIAKRANILRVMAESIRWGRRGARLNSISPGVISTSMGREELSGDSGEAMRSLIAASGTSRIGTSTDIAKAASFLLGPDSSFVTGADLLIDGGVLSVLRAGGS
jgi:NAD(P)-dependent dehydrogenase (short-subunit alcohol dehydrogenase family)